MGVAWEQYFDNVEESLNDNLAFTGLLVYSTHYDMWIIDIISLNPYFNFICVELVCNLKPGEHPLPAGKLPSQLPTMGFSALVPGVHPESAVLCCSPWQVSWLTFTNDELWKAQLVGPQLGTGPVHYCSWFLIEKRSLHCIPESD